MLLLGILMTPGNANPVETLTGDVTLGNSTTLVGYSDSSSLTANPSDFGSWTGSVQFADALGTFVIVQSASSADLQVTFLGATPTQTYFTKINVIDGTGTPREYLTSAATFSTAGSGPSRDNVWEWGDGTDRVWEVADVAEVVAVTLTK